MQRVWYERSPFLLFVALIPLTWLFVAVSSLRRLAFRTGLFRCVRMPRPVIVVGNITVGGTGKTPLVIWIVERLQREGFTVGVITRGYGGNASSWPQEVTPSSSPALVGDEAVLLALRTGAIVVASPDRVAAASRAITLGARVIVSDDGLQHYRLERNGEIIVLDGERGVGNGWRLPAGPLREARARINEAKLVVRTVREEAMKSPSDAAVVDVRHEVLQAQCLATGELRDLSSFAGAPVHAIAGIGNPEAFFRMLRRHGLTVDARALPDHAALDPADIAFPGSAPVLMTEKDAVKCRSFATDRHWAVRLDVRFSETDERRMTALLLVIANGPVQPRIPMGES
jgi:tetraacyldisaccharide 4'-kinase